MVNPENKKQRVSSELASDTDELLERLDQITGKNKAEEHKQFNPDQGKWAKKQKTKKRSSRMTRKLAIIAIMTTCLAISIGIEISNLTRKGTSIERNESRPNNLPDNTKDTDLLTTITGKVSYPSDSIPRIKICAIEVSRKTKYCREIPESETNYEYEIQVTPGRYRINYTTLERSNMVSWSGQCEAGDCSKFLVTIYTAAKGIRTIHGADLGQYNPPEGLVF